MFSAVLKIGSSLFYGENEEAERVPSPSMTSSNEGEVRRLSESVEDNWVIIGQDESMEELDTTVPVRDEVIPKKTDKKQRRAVQRRKMTESLPVCPKQNYSPYIKCESHFNHNKRSRNHTGRKTFAPIMQPRQRSFK